MPQALFETNYPVCTTELQISIINELKRYQMDTPSTMSLCILPTLSNSQISQNGRHVECEIHVISWIKISSC